MMTQNQSKKRYRLNGFNGGQPVFLTESELAEINANYNSIREQHFREMLEDEGKA